MGYEKGFLGSVMKILLAEDDANIVKIAKIVLEKVGGHQVQVCMDGGSALQTALQEDFDLLILDGMMPVLPGVEVCRQYQQQKQGRQAPVIFLSAKSTQEDIHEFNEIGCGYIQKPFEPQKLCALIDSILVKAA